MPRIINWVGTVRLEAKYRRRYHEKDYYYFFFLSSFKQSVLQTFCGYKCKHSQSFSTPPKCNGTKVERGLLGDLLSNCRKHALTTLEEQILEHLKAEGHSVKEGMVMEPESLKE